MIAFILATLLCLPLYAEENKAKVTQDFIVKITKDLPYIETQELGQKVIIQRIQDPTHKLSDDYSKTSLPCPPFCIQPTNIDKKIETIGELELLNFIKIENNDTQKALLIDARLASAYLKESIPSADNIPYDRVQNLDKASMAKIFTLFGMKSDTEGKWDFSKAKKLIIFSHAIYCDQSKQLIQTLTKHGYPKNLLYYYRSGLQGWKLLGLSTRMGS